MKRHALVTLVAVGLLSVFGVIPSEPRAGQAAQFDTSAIAVGPGFTLPGSGTSSDLAGKYPSVVGTASSVHMVANPAQAVLYWSKQDTAAGASGPTRIGSSKGDTDYTEAAIGAAPNGTL